MSPKAGFVLLDQIEPRLRATMPYIRGVGSEDTDDPAMAASRFVDWEEFLETHNPRYEAMVTDFAQGKRATDTAARFGFSNSWAHDLKEKLAGDLLEYFGEDAIADSMHVPLWRGNIRTDHEKALCRAERRH